LKRKLIEKHQTLREKILETIREAIINGTLKAGEKVAEPELAERFGISRTPIREAFRQLESEGYLTVIPRKGAVVTSLSERDVEELFALKSLIEGYAARLAATSLTEKEITRLEWINDRLQQLCKEGDVKTFFRMDTEFHELFIKAAGNLKLCEFHSQMLKKINRLRMASLSLPGRMEISVDEHRKIISAFKAGDGERANELVGKTASYGGQVLIQSLAQENGKMVRSDIIKHQVDV